MKELLRLIQAVLLGIAIGLILTVSYRCADAWYHGHSADPRCMYGMRGFVEVRTLGRTRELDRVSCQYRPEAATTWP